MVRGWLGWFFYLVWWCEFYLGNYDTSGGKIYQGTNYKFNIQNTHIQHTRRQNELAFVIWFLTR